MGSADHHGAAVLDPGRITLGDLRRIWAGTGPVTLTGDAYARIAASSQAVEDILKSGHTVYGINTGFGLLASTRISPEKLTQLQRNLVLSHSCGVGPDLDDRVVRLILALKLACLGRGHSGVRPLLAERLQAFIETEAYPIVPAQGSVGASGDLAPLAHIAAAMIGVGRIRIKGETLPAQEALARLGLEPLVLGPKEGLALINGTQVSTALALDALFRTEHIFAAAVASGALSVDALKGSDIPFDPRIHDLRGHQGQIDVAAQYRALLDGSEIRASHRDCDKVQDPYSVRCQPQVMGACLDMIRMVSQTLLTEANAVTDNPLIFDDPCDALSGGNFHGEPVAFAADMLSMALCEIASLSERRLTLLVDPAMSGLPAFLVADSGLNSGFMIAQVTAAALVSENRTSAHPSSVDSIPTSANQEDHVSMATTAARRACGIAANSAQVAAIELLAAAQGIEFHAPLVTSPALLAIKARIRAHVDPYTEDRYFADDIAAIARLVDDGAFLDAARPVLPSTT